jgi:arylsulfatase A-like enzyme
MSDVTGPDMNAVVGEQDLLLVTLDTLRYDVAVELAAAGRLPNLARVLPAGTWEQRHTPATLPFAAHTAFLAGYLPTPPDEPGRSRLFAARRAESESTNAHTWLFDTPDLPSALTKAGYHTACIGGITCFDKQGAHDSVLPGMFAESHWDPELGATSPISFEAQVARAELVVGGLDPDRRLFLLVDVAALHHPNWFHTPGAKATDGDTRETHAAALEYVDRHIGRLFRAVSCRRPCFAILTSTHGTAYGNDGYDVLRPVPYAEFTMNPGEW